MARLTEEERAEILLLHKAGFNQHAIGRMVGRGKTTIRRVVNPEAREADKERCRNYRKANPEAARERCRKWYEDNKEVRRKYSRNYRKENKEELREYDRKRSKSPQGKAADARKRVKRKRQKNAYPLSAEQKRQIDQFRANCPKGCHVDHKWPLAKGGIEHPLNLQYLTAEENMRKGGHLHQGMLPPIELAPGCFIEMPAFLL